MEKTFNAAEAEARISAKAKGWLDAKALAAAGANAKPGHPAFSVMIPPPNVTGSCTWATPSTTRCRTS
jgi:valyl-tRNA synthetase